MNINQSNVTISESLHNKGNIYVLYFFVTYR